MSAVLKDSEVLSVASAETESQSHASMKKEILKQIFLLWMVVDLYQKLQCPKNAKNAFCQTYLNRIVFVQNDFETCFEVQESPAINLLWEVVLIRYVSIRSPADSPDKSAMSKKCKNRLIIFFISAVKQYQQSAPNRYFQFDITFFLYTFSHSLHISSMLHQNGEEVLYFLIKTLLTISMIHDIISCRMIAEMG